MKFGKLQLMAFQTNPRGVGGHTSRESWPSESSFRPTLVGSEVSLIVNYSKSERVSDQPSWGRRMLLLDCSCGLFVFQTNPRGVGGTN